MTSYLHFLVAFSVTTIVVMAYTVAANVVALAAILLSRRKGVHNNITKLLMASMTTSDLLLSALVTPNEILLLITNGRWILGPIICAFWMDLSLVISTVGAWHVLVLAVDKYMAICRPLTYRILSSKAAMLMIAMAWIIPSAALFLPKAIDAYAYRQFTYIPNKCVPTFNKPFLTSYLVVLFFSPLSIAYVLYFIIHQEIRQYFKRMPKISNKSQNLETQKAVHSISSNQQTSTLSPEIQTTNNQRHQPKSVSIGTNHLPKHIRKQRKTVLTILSIVAVFTIFWIPTSIYFLTIVLNSPDNSIKNFQNSTFHEVESSSKSSWLPTSWVFFGFYWFSFLAATINPFLYYSMKSVRVKIMTLLCGHKKA